MAVPPAAAILSLAEAENLCAVIVHGDGQVAVAEHLDELAVADGTGGDEVVDADRAALREQRGETRSRLTTWYSVRNRLVKPLSLGSRMCSGICPPSKDAGTW